MKCIAVRQKNLCSKGISYSTQSVDSTHSSSIPEYCRMMIIDRKYCYCQMLRELHSVDNTVINDDLLLRLCSTKCQSFHLFLIIPHYLQNKLWLARKQDNDYFILKVLISNYSTICLYSQQRESRQQSRFCPFFHYDYPRQLQHFVSRGESKLKLKTYFRYVPQN